MYLQLGTILFQIVVTLKAFLTLSLELRKLPEVLNITFPTIIENFLILEHLDTWLDSQLSIQ